MENYFNPIVQHTIDFSKNNPLESRNRHPFNDKRLSITFDHIMHKTLDKQSLIIQHIADKPKEAAQFYRFFANPKVTTPEIIQMNCNIDPAILSGKDILCISDSTSFNMKKCAGHVKDFESFGVLNDGKTPGFHAHTSLALDSTDGSILGLSDNILWNRPADGKAYDRSSKEKKESYKWHLGAKNSTQTLQEANSINCVFDREADDFDLFLYLKNLLNVDFTIRMKHNRLVKSEGKKITIREYLESAQPALVYEVQLRALDHYSWTSGKRKKRQKRTATLELRFGTVEVQAPVNYPSNQSLKMGVVEVKEITEDLPEGEPPLNWIIWTSTHLVTAEDALTVVQNYLFRWSIEQLFRTMKKKGFNQEATQLGSVDGILKQTATVFKVATQVMQLVNSRDQQEGQSIEVLFNDTEQELLAKVNQQLEGKTEKLKNPFPINQLSYGAWVIARLGGWKGYKSQRPPGPLTMKAGLARFKIMLEGYLLFNSE